MNNDFMREVHDLKKARDSAQEAYYKAAPGKELVIAQQRLQEARVAYRRGTEMFFEDCLQQAIDEGLSEA